MFTENVFPANWKLLPMTEVVKWGSGGTPKATERDYYENGDIPWLIIGDLNDGTVTKSQTKITQLGLENSSAKLIPAGTLMVAMYGSIGKLGITGFECCTNQAIAFARKLTGVSLKYMFYYMSFIKPKLISMGKGGTQKNISQTVLNSLKVPVPPLDEQACIVARIEDLFSELDNGVQTLKTIKQQLAVYRQAVLKEAFANCVTVKTADVCLHITDGDHMPPPKAESGIPFIMISNIDGNIINWDNVNHVGEEYYNAIGEKRTPQKGDVLYTVTGSYGIPIRVNFDKKFCFQRHIALLRPNSKITQDFLFYALQAPNVYMQATQKATGTAQKTVGLGVLRNIRIPFCAEIAKQNEIVGEIESRLSVCDSIEKTVDTALAQAEAMRQSILKKAFEGGLV